MLAKAENRESRFGSTKRTRKLKANRVYPGIADEAVEYTKEERTPGQVDYLREIKSKNRTFNKICPERARYFTQGYRAADGQPEIIRMAKGIANVLDKMTIYIEDNELIVGNYAQQATFMPVYPEFFCDWIEEAIGSEGMYMERVTEEERQELNNIVDYWKDKSYGARIRALVPPHLENYKLFNGVALTCEVYEVQAGVTAGFDALLTKGANGILKECRQRLAEVHAENLNGKTNIIEYQKKKTNLEAMIIANEAFSRFGKRYAALAREKAAAEKNPSRKKDLERIAEVCDRVPAEPARTLHEALQSWFFFHMIQAVIEYRDCGCTVRFDVMFNPYYQKELEAGTITREQALELIECLWIKMEGISNIRTPQAEMVTVGSSQFQTFTLGGVLENGEDAVNDMSFLALDASINVHTIQPTHVVRYHSKINPEFIDRCIDCIRTGLGFPAFLSDKVAYPMYLRQGVPETEIWNWLCPSCISRSMPNKNMRQGGVTMGYYSYGKCLYLALNRGIDKWTGQKIGCDTGDPLEFKSIEDVKQAYLKQVEYTSEKMMQMYYISEQVRVQMFGRPLVAPYLDECIERAASVTDFTAYETYQNPEVQVAGPINVADSLTAMKKLIFDEKKVTMKELLDALENNWEGKEELRQIFLNAPKYGNDIPEADKMARWVHHESQKVLGKYKDYWGGQVRSQGALTSAYYSFGRACQATPDGRLDSQPFADGTCSPMASMDKKGPTATLKSVSKIDPALANEMLLNQKFMPQFLEAENKKLFADYLKTWYDLGCWHIQFNVVDKNVLLDAQVHPENYPDLTVRVAGYSAYFVDLGKPMQDDIIRRTEQTFSC